MSGPLKGVKVLDLSRVLAGPYCSMILGDLGADVIKVEAPGGSDDTRAWGPPYAGTESAYYLCANRNKRGITLNLKSAEGKQILKRLIKQSDVIIENFKSGTMNKWGLGYDDLKEINERIIYCSITGFGHTGPYRNLPGYDFIIQAMGGLMSITGSEESGPMKVGVAISDVLTGLYAVTGIMSALYERESSGEGQYIDISLLDSQVSALINVASNYLVSGNVPKRLGNEHPNIVPYQTFPSSDGEMVVAVGNDGQFKRFCNVIGLEQLAEDPRFATNPSRLANRKELSTIIAEQMKQRTSEEWLRLLNEHGIPGGPINDMEGVFSDPQVAARNMVVSLKHPTSGDIKLVGSPLKLSRTEVDMNRHPPMVGEHTSDVLTELGFTEEEINEWKAKKII